MEQPLSIKEAQNSTTTSIGSLNLKDCFLRFTLRKAAVECCVTVIPKEGHDTITISPDLIHQFLAEHAVTVGIDMEAIDELCRKSEHSHDMEDYLIAQGRAPEAGQDETIEFLVTILTDELQPSEDEAGHVDFHNVTMFTSVNAGEKIAVIHAAVPGKAGSSVAGQPVPPPESKLLKFEKLENVKVNNDGSVIAGKTGMVIYKNNSLVVTDEFVVNGDVDFKIGNITFNGIVRIRGDVLDDFKIVAEKGIFIAGVAGACTLISAADIEIGGMNGQHKGTIICGGTLTANYLHDVKVQCKKDVIIRTEAMNTDIKAGGRVIISNGMLTGGETIALSGIEAKLIGSKTGIGTTIIAGMLYEDVAQLRALYIELQKISVNLDKVKNKKTIEDLYSERNKLRNEIINIRKKEKPGSNAKINVKGALLDHVDLTLGDLNQVLHDVTGAHSIIENPTEGTFLFLSLTPLEVLAQDLLKKYIPPKS